MTRFRYAGISNTGAPVSGEREGETPHGLIAALRDEGTFVHEIEDLDHPGRFRRPEATLQARDLTIFTTQLAALIQSGMPLASALGELVRESRHHRLRPLLEEAKGLVEGGHTLEDALSRKDGALPPLYISLIRVGERTGNLPAVLLHLSEFSQRRVQMSQRIQATLAYPIVVFVCLWVFLGVFAPLVIGQFETMFAQMGATLPWITTAMLKVGDLLKWTAFLPPLLLILCIPYAILLRSPARRAVRRIRESILLVLPVAGRLYATMLEARFYQALGLLLENGAPIVESLYLAGSATGSPRIEAASLRAASRVAQGEPVSQTLTDSRIASGTHGWMLQQAEAAGTLPQSLRRLAEICNRELEMEQQTIFAGAGPILISIAGLITGISVLACFLPIFQISTLVHP